MIGSVVAVKRANSKVKPDNRSRGSKREEILRGASALFVERGLHAVSTRQIAEAAGISQPSLYAHFATKDAIAVELCCRAFDELHEGLARAVARNDAPHERIRELSRTYIEFGLHNEAAYRVAFMLELPSEQREEKSRVLAAGLRAFGVLRSAFENIASGPDQANLAAQSAWASMHGIVSLLLARSEFPFERREALIEKHLDSIMMSVPLPAK